MSGFDQISRSLVKLSEGIANNNSLLCVRLDPDPDLLAGVSHLPIADQITHLRDWLRSLLDSTQDLVCAYKIIPDFYWSFGQAGMELFLDILSSIPDSVPVILDAKYGHVNTSGHFAETIFKTWNLDAVTLSPFAGQDQVAPFLVYPDKAVFVVCATTNPSAAKIQHWSTHDDPFYLHLVREAKTWGTPDQVGLEIGATPDVFAQIRAIVPERLLLVQDTWANEDSLTDILSAGLNSNGEGLILLVPKELLSQSLEPATLATNLKQLRDRVNDIRDRLASAPPQCEVWFPSATSDPQHPHEDLILRLYDLGCIQFGEYVQASGAVFPYYVDLRTIISNPQVFDAVINSYAEILETLHFDRIAGIPYGSLPTATGLSLKLNHPMIFPRKEVKAHGTRRLVEGQFEPGETVVVVDDILITGRSVIEGAEKLKSVGLEVQDIVVFIDHDSQGGDRLQQAGYHFHSVLSLHEIAETLYHSGRLSQDQLDVLLHNLTPKTA